MFSGALEAGFWGMVAGSALIIGAVIGYYLPVTQRLIATVMAFGAGVLISVLAFDLMEAAYEQGGFTATAVGFLSGAAIYTVANILISRQGAAHRKRSGHQMAKVGGSGTILAVGALIDGIPESIVVGLSLLSGGGVSAVAVIGIFISNIPEGLSSSAGMRKAGHSARYVLGVWIAIAIASGVSAFLGYAIFGSWSDAAIAAIIATAAGGVLAMLADTMIPEAFETTHELTGLITVAGFLLAFLLTKIEG